MDFYSVPLLIGAAQGIFFSLLLRQGKTGNRSANRILSLLLLPFSASLVDGFMDYRPWEYQGKPTISSA
jgi:hypothetical protein